MNRLSKLQYKRLAQACLNDMSIEGGRLSGEYALGILHLMRRSHSHTRAIFYSILRLASLRARPKYWQPCIISPAERLRYSVLVHQADCPVTAHN